MSTISKASATILALGVAAGLTILGFLLAQAAIDFKTYDRSVTVKGLSEKEFEADIVIWPIQFLTASNDLSELYTVLEKQTNSIQKHLRDSGIEASEISTPAPSIIDKSAQAYGNNGGVEFRYSATQTVTVYSKNIALARSTMNSLTQLGKQGIVFTSNDYGTSTEYLFTRLNEIKPGMIEEATTKAREVALKFATDSQSSLGKIKRARQGQFSISARDNNNPHIKRIRVVSTVEYYLSD